MNEFSFIHLKETDSTNLYLRELSRVKKLPQGLSVYADIQSAGRGQKGTSWESEKGQNLLFSVILYPDNLEASGQFILSQIISLAVKDVLDGESEGFSIKWPNDIYYKDRKIAGILIENDIIDGAISQSVIGTGINLNQIKFISNASNPVSLKQVTGKDYEIEAILKKVLDRLEYYFCSLGNEPSVKEIRKKYHDSLYRKDGLYFYTDGEQTFKAEILSVEESGMLVLRKENGDVRKYFFKQIQFVL